MSKFLPRTTGIRTVTRELKRFAVVEPEYERCTSSRAACSFRLPPLLHFPPQPVRVLLMCLYKRGRSSPEKNIRRSSSSRHTVPNFALLLSSSSWLAACTARRDSRPPRPHLLSPVREKGDKVFGKRSARLLAASSRTIRSPTTTSPTTTSSPTSTTSSTTW